jgi:hypothetical protein
VLFDLFLFKSSSYIMRHQVNRKNFKLNRFAELLSQEINAEIARLKRFLEIILNRGFKRILVIGLRLVY